MKKSGPSDQQIAFALQQAETGTSVGMSAGSSGYPAGSKIRQFTIADSEHHAIC
jgi:hypothetical protein